MRKQKNKGNQEQKQQEQSFAGEQFEKLSSKINFSKQSMMWMGAGAVLGMIGAMAVALLRSRFAAAGDEVSQEFSSEGEDFVSEEREEGEEMDETSSETQESTRITSAQFLQ